MDVFLSHIGHETAKQVLLRMIEGNHIPHALLFVGSSHTGKTHFATALIQHLFQTTKSLSALNDVTVLQREMDVKTKKKKKAISVKQIRALIIRLSMTSVDGSWKVALIEEAHRLSIGASNALLKTLEEPKGQTLLILCAPQIESLLPTITSRCQIIRLSTVSKTEIGNALEKRGLSKDEAAEISARSLGRPGLALRYISDSMLRARKETAFEQARVLLRAPLAQQFGSVFGLIPKTELEKTDTFRHLLDDWSEVVRDELLRALGCTELCTTKRFSDEDDSISAVQNSITILNTIHNVRLALSHNINPHLALEHIFISTHI